MRKPDTLEKIVSPGLRFWTGIIIIPGYFLVVSPLIKLSLIILFSLGAVLAGKKIRYLYFIMMTVSITFFHLLTPFGRILWEFGSFRITQGALLKGFTKGITLAGLVFISLFSVTPSLRLPGKLGGLLGRMFYYFELILEGKKRVTAKDFIGSLDRILTEIFPPWELPFPAVRQGKRETGLLGNILYPLFWTCLVWGAVFLEVIIL